MTLQKSSPKKGRSRARKSGARSSAVAKARKSDNRQGRSGGAANPKAGFERYTELARAAAMAGDAIESERYFQHAEHCYRVMKNGPAS